MRGILAFVAASMACATGAQAQAPQAPAADPAPIPRYEVEVIVFAHRDFDPTEESFDQTLNGFDAAALREVPSFDESTFASRDAPQTSVLEPLAEVDPLAAERAEALRVRPLRPDELKLGGEYRKLRAISAYEPLVHVGWVQPGLPETDAVPIDLGTLGILNPRGTVRVHLSRFLHITLDLTYHAKGSAAPAATAATARDGASAANAGSSLRPAGDGLDEIVVAPQYRLRATRNVRSNELHYFDHPAFGVLVRVTPVPAEVSGGRRPAA
ncbi:MAG TPA: CsiV family protein [Gammaproteobacteria bacterium]|nr:CsiV family protein [Gammaproteobacteria bacterium]